MTARGTRDASASKKIINAICMRFFLITSLCLVLSHGPVLGPGFIPGPKLVLVLGPGTGPKLVMVLGPGTGPKLVLVLGPGPSIFLVPVPNT